MERTMTTMLPRDPGWEEQCRASFSRQGFMTLIGAEIVALRPGHCTVAVAARPELCQQRGFLHGGLTAALADTAAGYAAYSLMPGGSSPLTVEFKINLMAPAVGTRFLAAATVVRSGRTLSVVEADVTAEQDGDAVPVAKMLATLMCLESTPDQKAPSRV
jgi:uncharacterized protein (TIGR00369 family)